MGLVKWGGVDGGMNSYLAAILQKACTSFSEFQKVYYF